MEYFFKQLKRLRDASALDARKKEAIRSEIVSYIRASNAVREQAEERHSIGKRSATLTNAKNNMKLIRFAAPIAILVLLGGGASFAAASALPGDALYPVKVEVNEKVAAAFKFSAEDKAEFEVRLAEKRLAEAGALAAEGRLDGEASTRVQQSFEAFADRVEARIEDLRESGDEEAADKVSVRFETALQAHARALAALQARMDAGATSTATSSVQNKGNTDSIIKLTVPVKAALKNIRERSLNAQATSSVSAGSEVVAGIRITAATEAVADARELLAKETARVGGEISGKADAELDAADTLIARAEAKAAAGAYVEAIKLANRAAQAAKQVSVLLSLQAKLSAEANANAGFDLFGNDPGQNSEDDQDNDRGPGSDDGADESDDDDNNSDGLSERDRANIGVILPNAQIEF